MDNNSNNKKSTYNAKAQRKYNEKRKSVSFITTIEKAEQIADCIREKGYNSMNDYLKKLVSRDLGIDL